MNAKTRALFVCALASSVLAGAAATQAHAADPAARYKAPRNGFGQPDLTGTWSNGRLTRMERPPEFGGRLVPTAEEIAKLEGAQTARVKAGSEKTPHRRRPRRALPGAVRNRGQRLRRPVRLQSDLLRQRQPRHAGERPAAHLADHLPRRRPHPPPGHPAARGWPRGGRAGRSGKPRVARPLPGRPEHLDRSDPEPDDLQQHLRVPAVKDEMVIVVEMVHDARIVRLNATPPDGVRPLVRQLRRPLGGRHPGGGDHQHAQAQAYRAAGSNLKVVRALHPRGAKAGCPLPVRDKIRPSGSKPWGGEYEFSPLKGMIYEYACHEGNYALAGILAGERQAEAAAKETTRRGLRRRRLSGAGPA